MLLGEPEYVSIRNVELGLGKVRGTVAIVVLIECQQAVRAVTFDVADEACQTTNNLRVSLCHIGHRAGTEIDLELEAMKRTTPPEHLRIDEGSGVTCAQADYVRVIVDQARR